MWDLQAVYKECLRKCDEAGIRYGKIVDVTANSRAKKRWGCCRRNSDGGLSLSINSMLLADDVPLKALEETILHEICHTVQGGHNHTGAWKQCAAVLNSRYGYAIKRTSTNEEKGLAPEVVEADARYQVQCTQCGNTIGRQRRSRLITETSRYRCGRCGGTFVRIK